METVASTLAASDIRLDDLQSVALASPLNRSRMAKDEDSKYTEEYVESQVKPGIKICVAWQGDRRKPALLTYHDLGLNYVSNFQAFFNFSEMTQILERFCIYHINAPGQEDNAETMADNLEYPTMDELSEQVNEVINHFSIVRYVGIGVGLGGNVLIRHAMNYPERVDCLMLVNALCTAPGWVEWGYQKRNVNHLRSHGVTQAVVDYLSWHHFGSFPEERSYDLLNMFKHYFSRDINAKNLAKLSEQYNWRLALNIDREWSNEEQKGDAKTLKVPVLNMTGSRSPFVNETVTLNGKLNPSSVTWMKIQDSAMVLEEQPTKVCEAFLLFLQGQGHCLNIRRKSVGNMLK